jgi:putative aldouronate transport system permease protein
MKSATRPPDSSPAAAPALYRRKKGWAGFVRDVRANASLIVMAMPAVAWIILFSYVPMFGIVIAFKNYRAIDGILGSQWVGLKNFEFLFLSDGIWRATRNTLVMNFLFIVTGTLGSVTVALLLNEVRSRILSRAYQASLFFPYFISIVIVSYFAFMLLSTDFGLLNKLVAALGGQKVSWYSTPGAWPFILVVVNLWKGIGYGSIIYLAAILGIHPEYFEAAQLDGATKLQQIRYITLPHLMPVMTILVLLSIGGIFRADFGLFYIVTRNQGVLYPTTDVIDTFVYRALQEINQPSMAAAAGLYQTVVGFLLVLAANWVVKKIDPERSLF